MHSAQKCSSEFGLTTAVKLLVADLSPGESLQWFGSAEEADSSSY